MIQIIGKNICRLYLTDIFNIQNNHHRYGNLADTLYFIIYGLNFRDTKGIFVTSQDLAADFLHEAFDDKINCNTWGLLHVGVHYLEI